MIDRKEALKLLKKYIKTENTIKHMMACEAIMRSLARKLQNSKTPKFQDEENFNEDEWGMAGLVHDLDYEIIDQETKEGHGLKTIEILKQEGINLPESVYQTILAHNYENLDDKYAPQNKMDWSLFICDSLTGLIVATALVRPSKKLADVKLKSIKKKFKQPSFAAGTRREDIKLCEEKLGIPLDEFIEIGLKAMQGISEELGL